MISETLGDFSARVGDFKVLTAIKRSLAYGTVRSRSVR